MFLERNSFYEKHEKVDHQLLQEQVNNLPDIFQAEFYDQISEFMNTNPENNGKRDIVKFAMSFCNAKLYQFNPKRINQKADRLYRRDILNKYVLKRVKQSPDVYDLSLLSKLEQIKLLEKSDSEDSTLSLGDKEVIEKDA